MAPELFPLIAVFALGSCFLALPILIVALIYQSQTRKLEAFARGRGGRVIKGFWRRRVEYEVEGVAVGFSFRAQSKNNPGETRFHYDLPTSKGLRLAPEGVLTGVRKMFGTQDIIVGEPAFDEAFLVQGPDEEWVRQRLGDRARELLMAMNTLSPSGFLFRYKPQLKVDFSPAGLIIRWRTNLVNHPASLEEAADLADNFLREIAGLDEGPAISVQEVLRDRKCPVCQDAVSGANRSCPSCRAAYHPECWSYLNGCAVFGCRRMYRRKRTKA